MSRTTRETPARDRQAPLRYPDFFVVGHPKSGTTALYEMLRHHPQIFLPAVKEPNFFVPDADLRRPIRRRPSEARYLELFAGARAGQKTGEASPHYLASRSAAGHIAATNPGARIIAILREPAAFIWSLHLHYIRRGLDRPGDLGAAFTTGASGPLRRFYETRVRYVEQLERYRSVLPASQLLVLIYDDYRRSNAETMRRVFHFLGVDERLDVVPREVNGSTGIRSRSMAVAWDRLVMGQSRVAGQLRRVTRAAIPRAARHAVEGAYTRVNVIAPSPMDDEIRSRLRAAFNPEVRKLSEYMDRDLAALWRYPQ